MTDEELGEEVAYTDRYELHPDGQHDEPEYPGEYIQPGISQNCQQPVRIAEGEVVNACHHKYGQEQFDEECEGVKNALGEYDHGGDHPRPGGKGDPDRDHSQRDHIGQNGRTGILGFRWGVVHHLVPDAGQQDPTGNTEGVKADPEEPEDDRSGEHGNNHCQECGEGRNQG